MTMRLREAERTFVYDRLLPGVLSPSTPKTWNLLNEFESHIRSLGSGPIRSIEFAVEHFYHLSDFIELHLSYWDEQGIPRPLTSTDQDYIFLAWSHERFAYYSGLSDRIDANFCEMFLYLQQLDGKRFLVVCALWLKAIGFDRVIVTDKAGDGGVDLLGMVSKGGLKSLVVVVQAKTSGQPISRGTVLEEYSKYRMVMYTEKHLQYRSALEIDSSVDGSSWIYMILSNQAFDSKAHRASNGLGILLRSIHQIASVLASQYPKSVVEDEVERLVGPLEVDLTLNFCDRIAI